jgi:hypothetical protein
MQGSGSVTSTNKDKNRVPPRPSFSAGGKNRGGRPRKDGTRADNSATLAELGINKRVADDARLYASVPDDVFEAALDRRQEIALKGGRVPSLRAMLPDRRANSRHQRETVANMARMVSTARLILAAHEFDASAEGELLRRMAERTIELWTTVTVK